MTSQEKRKQELNKKKIVLAIWSVFIVVAIVGVILFIKNYGKLKKASDNKESKIYELNKNSDINFLIKRYLGALTGCDQETLKNLVTDPSQFDNMTIYISRSNNVTGYSNIDCYTVDGMTDDSKLVFVVGNVSLKDVESKPKDIMVFYVVNVDGKYLINNEVDTKIQNHIEKMTVQKDIQEIYKMVKEDEDKCYEEDETLRKFYERINGTN